MTRRAVRLPGDVFDVPRDSNMRRRAGSAWLCAVQSLCCAWQRLRRDRSGSAPAGFTPRAGRCQDLLCVSDRVLYAAGAVGAAVPRRPMKLAVVS